MIRSSVILASLLFSSTAPASVILSDSVEVSPKSIVQVVCVAPDKNPALVDLSLGTAFRIGNGLALSVKHVTSARGECFADGKRMKVLYTSPTSDFSMIQADDGPFLKVNCGGFIAGRKYIALGYARGLPQITQVELTATGKIQGGLATLDGIFAVVPGQSGGPVVDAETGEVVGTVNEEDFYDGVSGSVPLSQTYLCKGHVA